MLFQESFCSVSSHSGWATTIASKQAKLSFCWLTDWGCKMMARSDLWICATCTSSTCINIDASYSSRAKYTKHWSKHSILQENALHQMENECQPAKPNATGKLQLTFEQWQWPEWGWGQAGQQHQWWHQQVVVWRRLCSTKIKMQPVRNFRACTKQINEEDTVKVNLLYDPGRTELQHDFNG